MAQMFNPAKQWQAFKQGSIDPANPLVDKIAKVDPLNDDRKRLMAYEQPEVKGELTPNAPVQASGALGAAGDNVTAPSTMKKPKSVAASALLNK